MAATKTSVGEGSSRFLKLEIREGGVAEIVLDGPGPVNTLSEGLLAEIDAALERIERDPEIHAVLLVSGKKEGFIAGADIEMLQRVKSAAEGAVLSRGGKELLARIERGTKPWLAAIHGACLGGGCEVALACHYRIATDEKATQIGLPEVQLGLLPGAGGTQRLPRLIGIQAALDLILAGKAVAGRKALRLGLVDEVVPRAILIEVARRRAVELGEGLALPERGSQPTLARMRKPNELARLALEENPVGRKLLFQQAHKRLLSKTRGHYPAPERALEAIRVGYEKGLADGYEAESLAVGDLCVSEQAARLIEIFFASNALKKDSGVDDAAVKPREVRRIGMLGGGLMGGGIAYVSTNAGYGVRLKDKDDAGVGRGLAYVRGILDERVARKRQTRLEAEQVMARLTGTSDYSGLHGSDLFIEAVFEDLEVKQRVLREVEGLCREEAIFASNTSSLPIGKIALASKRPENVVGMHYFSPVHKMPLLEVIRHKTTSDVAVATAVAVGKRQGKTVIVVHDGVGFYTSRILAPYVGEAGYLLDEGAAVDEIDRALVEFGFPVGPLQLLDEVGIDIAGHVAKIMLEAFGARMAPPAGFEKLARDGRAGRKNKKGFYTYDGKKKSVDPTVYDLLSGGRKRTPIDRAAAAERVALQMANEAAHCLGEGILRSPRDGDIGAVFGLGFPPFRGGPFRWLERLGLDRAVGRPIELEGRHGARFSPAPLLVERAKAGQKFYG